MPLPKLRPDLQLLPAANAFDGSPQWTLADPLRGKFFKLSERSVRMLRYWSRGDAAVLLAAAAAEGDALQLQDVQAFERFLRNHDLIAATDPLQRQSYGAKAAQQKKSFWTLLLHQYLFFRIPLWRPDDFLNRTWPWLARHGGTLLRWGIPCCLLLGGYLVMRDWERFKSSFPYLFSWGGMAAFGIALGLAKFAHEFGHAFMAKRAGCRVHSMGIAFVVMLPMFYTDVTDAWRVTERKSRLLIGAGGVLVELLLACVALLLWSFLADGPLRSAVFMLASATWITTLAINLNPLMRFDGYFLLSDLWAIDNLQNRAFALCRWRLREWLFGYGEATPEPWPRPLRRRLLVWGFASWIWRAVLFFGIALAVYHLFFKTLGIVLMAVELGWFIVLPVVREAGHWWREKRHAAPRRTLLSATLGLLLLAALCVPWSSSVELPALLLADRVAAINPPSAAQIVRLAVAPGAQVAEGDVLAELAAPDLAAKLSEARQEVQITQAELRRRASLAATAGAVEVLEQQLSRALADYRGLDAQAQRLLLKAPQAGTVREILPGLAPGLWVGPRQTLLKVVGEGWRVRAYLTVEQSHGIEAGSHGRMIFEDPRWPAIEVKVAQIDSAGVASIREAALTSDHGGAIAVRRDGQGRAVPVSGYYGVDLAVVHPLAASSQVRRGVVRLEGEAHSLLGRAVGRLAAVFRRESGF